jgi:O-antigen ligase
MSHEPSGEHTIFQAWRRTLAYLAVILVPAIAFVGDLGLAPMLAILGMGALVFLGRRTEPDLGAAMLLGLLGFALLSMVWAPVLPHQPDFHRYKEVEGLIGLKLVFQLALYGAFLAAMRGLDAKTAGRAGLVLAMGLAIMAALLLAESLEGAVLYKAVRAFAHQSARPDIALRDAARGCYVGVVLFWPSALRLRLARQPLALFALGAGLAGAGLVFRVDAPVLALLLSGIAFAAVMAGGRRAIACIGVAAVLYFAAAPTLAHFGTKILGPHQSFTGVAKASWAERIDIWRFTAGEIMQDPTRGWGLDASRAWPEDIPVHPHDAALQIWLELGAFGVAIVGLFYARLFSRIASCVEEDRPLAAASVAATTAYLTIGALSFGVWQEWWLALGALTVMQCRFVQVARRSDREEAKDLAILQPIG